MGAACLLVLPCMVRYKVLPIMICSPIVPIFTRMRSGATKSVSVPGPGPMLMTAW
ncbi:hypothetical protein D3C71_2179580 [compost metagenome]